MTEWQASGGFSDYGQFGVGKGRRGLGITLHFPASTWCARRLRTNYSKIHFKLKPVVDTIPCPPQPRDIKAKHEQSTVGQIEKFTALLF